MADARGSTARLCGSVEKVLESLFAFLSSCAANGGRGWLPFVRHAKTAKTENLLKTVAAPAAFPRRLQISLGVRMQSRMRSDHGNQSSMLFVVFDNGFAFF
jgi:hypothetical protein